MLALKEQGSQISLQSSCVPSPATAVISRQGTQPTLSQAHCSICLATEAELWINGHLHQIQWWQGWYNTKLTPALCKSVHSELSKNSVWFPNIQDFPFVTFLCSLHARGEEEGTTGTRQVPCPRFFRKTMMLQSWRGSQAPSPGCCPSLLGIPQLVGHSCWEMQNHHRRGNSWKTSSPK